MRSTDRGTLNLTSATPFTFSLTSAIESGTVHLGKSIPAAAGNCRFFVARPLVFAAKSFRMRTSEKHRILHYFGANKSFRIHTYRLRSRKSFRIRTYKNRGEGTPRESGENSKIEAIAQDHFRNQMIR